ncbi:MAG: FAD-dependent oxidoreductase [Patescibacteria group bacterium]
MRVAIVGAGICGLYLAWKLSETGNEVTVFEKKEKIGKEACSGLISEKIVNFIPESKKLIQNKIESVLIHFPKKTLRIRFSKKFFVMDRAELDRLTAILAEKSGAKIILNCPIEGFDLRAKPVLRFARENNYADYGVGVDRIVGCDGPFSQIRKSLGQNPSKMRLAIQGFFRKKDFADFVETWPTKAGFLWKIPRGENTEYGIIEKPAEARNIFDDFLKKNDLRLENIKSAPVPRGFLMPKNNKVSLCGDAAGLVKPWSGGGVIWGLTAAGILLKNFPDFIKYQKGVKREFYAKIVFSGLATSLVYFFGFKIPWLLPANFEIDGDFLKL